MVCQEGEYARWECVCVCVCVCVVCVCVVYIYGILQHLFSYPINLPFSNGI